MFRAVAFVVTVALALSIAGGILGTHVNPDAHTGLLLRRIAAGVFAGECDIHELPDDI